jgi:hypothetical protein
MMTELQATLSNRYIAAKQTAGETDFTGGYGSNFNQG